jgi:hypothetical protein
VPPAPAARRRPARGVCGGAAKTTDRVARRVDERASSAPQSCHPVSVKMSSDSERDLDMLAADEVLPVTLAAGAPAGTYCAVMPLVSNRTLGIHCRSLRPSVPNPFAPSMHGTDGGSQPAVPSSLSAATASDRPPSDAAGVTADWRATLHASHVVPPPPADAEEDVREFYEWMVKNESLGSGGEPLLPSGGRGGGAGVSPAAQAVSPASDGGGLGGGGSSGGGGPAGSSAVTASGGSAASGAAGIAGQGGARRRTNVQVIMQGERCGGGPSRWATAAPGA